MVVPVDNTHIQYNTKPNQTKPYKTKPNKTKPNQTKPRKHNTKIGIVVVVHLHRFVQTRVDS